MTPIQSTGRSRTGTSIDALRRALIFAAFVTTASPVSASDHADPIDVFGNERLEAGITDLFVFPIKDNEEAAFPFMRTDDVSLAAPNVDPRPALSDDERSRIKALVVILCVRRQLTQTGSLRLGPYTYRVHMDLHSTVSFADTEADHDHGPAEPGVGYAPGHSHDTPPKRPTGAEGRARYGGLIVRPDQINGDVTISVRLQNDPKQLNGSPVYMGLKNPETIKLQTGVFDDPFIFPAFFGTNIVGMVWRIPIECFPQGQQDWIVWATSHEGDRQIDHVGRSLRTQNPRFELLNTLPPREHVAAIKEEHEHPGLLRDIFLRANFQQAFAYRMWDQVPDVMIYTTRFPVGFPNGRLLTDDVAALLAQHGDTLLLELSHHNGGWPRRTTNDKPFSTTFPYLAEPWDDKPPNPPPMLSTASKIKLAAIVLGLLALLALENWFVAVLYHRKKQRRRYL